MAVATGVRADNCTRPVPSRTVLVPRPHQARGVKASEPYDPADHTESKPSRSASATTSAWPSGRSRPQYPSWTPSFTGRDSPTQVQRALGATVGRAADGVLQILRDFLHQDVQLVVVVHLKHGRRDAHAHGIGF